MMKRGKAPRARWELWARPALALVFIAVYRVAACNEDPSPPVTPQPPTWVVEDQGLYQGR